MMKIRKEYVIVLVILFAMLGGLAAAYQMFYKTKVQQFADNIEKRSSLDSKLSSLESTFKNAKPAVMVEAFESRVAPLTQAVEVRSQKFSMGDILKVDPVPEKEMARFYYEKQYRALMTEMTQIAYSRAPYFQFPMSTFGEPSPDQLLGAALTNEDVMRSVRWIKFGIHLIKFLRDAKAQAIYNIELWRPRDGYSGTLKLRTVGLAFTMNLADLVAFFESMRTSSDRYYSVESFSISNPSLISAGDPLLLVQMVLTMGEYITPGAGSKPTAAAGGTAAPGAGGAPTLPGLTGMMGMMGSSDPSAALKSQGFGLSDADKDKATAPPPTAWAKFVKLLKAYFWPF